MSHTPASDHPHVTEGICTCIHVGLTRVPVAHCGLSSHRVEARRSAQEQRSRA